MAIYTSRRRFSGPALLVMSGLLLLSGCASLTGGDTAKVPEIVNEPVPAAAAAGAVTLDECRTQALALDRSARTNGVQAQYFTSARTLNDCLAEVDAATTDQQALMQMRGLVILNFVKAGQLARARQALQAFQTDFDGQDLYFADYSSFVDTFSLLLGERHLSTDSALTLNVNKKLVAELRRQHYWSSH